MREVHDPVAVSEVPGVERRGITGIQGDDELLIAGRIGCFRRWHWELGQVVRGHGSRLCPVASSH